MSLQFRSLSWIFKIVCFPEVRRFEKSLGDPALAQLSTLKKITGAASVEEFRAGFPMTDESQIPNLAEVVSHELTSGSSGFPKRIPYTKELLSAFHKMFRLWAWDVLENVPLKKGQFFFSISPQEKETSLPEDSDYLGRILNFLLKPFWSVDAKQLRRQNPETFMNALGLELLRHRDLEVVSVWSPSYWLTILDEIQKNYPEPVHWPSVWPHLKFISCWGSATADFSYQKIQKLFPAVVVQKKGLLATEAPMTIPWFKAAGFVPLVGEIFFEFIDESKNLFLLHELKLEKIYEVVITTPGRLFRYQIGDLVGVTGFYKKTPLLDFIGRTQDTSDLVGEKLSGIALREKLKDFGFFISVPSAQDQVYHFFFENDVSKDVDRILREIYHYDVARAQKQLSPAQILHRPTIRTDYFNWHELRGLKLGDIKESNLISDTKLASDFLEHLKTAFRQQPTCTPTSAPQTDSFAGKSL